MKGAKYAVGAVFTLLAAIAGLGFGAWGASSQSAYEANIPGYNAPAIVVRNNFGGNSFLVRDGNSISFRRLETITKEQIEALRKKEQDVRTVFSD